jgi:hypothetical protein
MTNESNVREWTAVPAYAVAGLVAKGERLAKTAAKLGVPAPVVTVTNRRVRKIYDDILGDTGRTEAVADVTLSGLAPQLPGGWTLLAAIEHAADGDEWINLVHGGEGADPKYRTAAPDCDHCGLNRGRKSTFLVVDEDGNVQQVGRNCLADFLGHHMPNPWAYMLELNANDEDWEPRGHHDHRQDAEEAVALAMALTDCFGYVKAANPRSTAGRAREVQAGKMNKDWSPAEKAQFVNFVADNGGWDAFEAEARAAIHWLLTDANTGNDYLWNLATVFRTAEQTTLADGTLRYRFEEKRLGLVVSLAPTWNREKGKIVERDARQAIEAERRANADDVPVGRVTITGTIVRAYAKETPYGTRYVMTVLGDGGWKVWGTVPTNLDGTLDSMAGRAVSFTAAVEASDDPTFGFYKRPTKAVFTDAAAAAADDAVVCEHCGCEWSVGSGSKVACGRCHADWPESPKAA